MSLTSADGLRALLGEVTVLDVRWRLGRDDGHEQHLAGHVPTAAYVDLAADLADPPGDSVDFETGPGPARVIDAAGAARVARDGVLVDARAPDRFRGSTSPSTPSRVTSRGR